MSSAEHDAREEPAARHPIVFFDGVCGMCDRFVVRVLRADREGRLRFAPLQGETARRLLGPLPADARDWSLVYVDERGVHRRSDASLEICRRLGGVPAILSLARCVPRPVRDALYRWVARHRYRWFPRRNSCRIPSAEELARFLP